jgi:hypothetical protein
MNMETNLNSLAARTVSHCLLRIVIAVERTIDSSLPYRVFLSQVRALNLARESLGGIGIVCNPPRDSFESTGYNL